MECVATIFNMSKARRSTPRPPTRRVWRKIYLREWREERDLSVEALGEIAGVSPGLISLIENRKSAGSPDSLEKLADALKITLGDLLEMRPDPDGVIVRAWVRKENRQAVEDVIKAMKGKPIPQ